MRRAAIIQTVLFLLLSLTTMTCWCQPAAAYSLDVKAWIDGESQLIIKGNTVQWHNLRWNAPGYEYPYGSPPRPYLSDYKSHGNRSLDPHRLVGRNLWRHNLRQI
jgi:hypothetical protein